MEVFRRTANDHNVTRVMPPSVALLTSRSLLIISDTMRHLTRNRTFFCGKPNNITGFQIAKAIKPQHLRRAAR
ncbi:hypothetical protein D3C84_1202550 [compost metagenome]